MDALMTASGAPITMTSQEIAELTGKRHDHVMRDIRGTIVVLHGEGGLPNFGDTAKSTQNGQSYPIFRLPKRECLVLMAGYSIPLRARIIDRWDELEKSTAKLPDLSNPAALRTLLLGYTEKVLALQAENAALAPKAQFHDAVADASNTQSVEEAAKVLGMSRVALFKFLRDDGMLMANNLPYQHHLDAGRFKVVEKSWDTEDGQKRNYTQTRVTGKGLSFIQLRLSKQREAVNG